MVQIDAKYKGYIEDFEISLKNSSGAMKDFKTQAWNHFCEIGMPTARKGNEKWKYTNVGPILNSPYRIPATGNKFINSIEELGFKASKRIKLVFVNGQLDEQLSSKYDDITGISIIPLREALNSGISFVEKHLGAHAPYSDGFVSLNSALFDQGLFIEVDANDGDMSIEIIHIASGLDNVASYPRLLVNVKESADMSITEGFYTQDIQEHFTNAVTEIVLDKNAALTHNKIMFESMESVHMGVTHVYQSEGSNFKASAFSNGSRLARNEMSVLLDGVDAACDLIGLYLTVGDQHIDNLINIDHASPNCFSNISYKGILDGNSRAVFGGEVLVRKDSQKTNAVQSDKNLLLSEGAEVDSKPSLMIYADDVVCGHGATAGNINNETVFYMRSRGLDEKMASKFLIQAFAREIIERLDDPGFMEYVDSAYEVSIPDVTLNLG